ncbi:PNGase F N-terminal domain-containing protein [Kordia sp.]|uniref:peptide-N-glycosidase F-related protein n=1 Tax=Kordia sp. TaxID=1965332 RepID=UPI0025B906DD|nr:PNGase F N-terminal domain-containing protein [Kordia sp.]MCH2196056.1 N-glycanase [Kordia sp.]
MKNIQKISLFIIIFCTACTEQKLESIGDTSITVFNKENLHFNMAFKENVAEDENGLLRLDAGRVLVKKIKLPDYQLQPEVTLHVTLTSNGDPWDKSGSMFVIPKTSNLSLVDFETGKFDLKTLKQKFPAISTYKKDSLLHEPNLELLRFMTPFGVGHFTNDERVKSRKPVYIPKWENEVNWSQNITHLLPLLEDEVYVGVFIDTWTKEGYNITATLDFKESEIPNHAKKQQTIIPLVNTSKYASDQKLYDEFSRSDLTVTFEMPASYKNAKLYYITTGHGGHAGGDEFVKKENNISLDGETIKAFIPWRDDCASFRRFNPTSGTWKANEFYDDVDDCEKIASSDLSRSNWCPGSDIQPEIIPLDNISQGKHTLKISIPEAQEAKQGEDNYWMVSAYIVYDNE